jgi:hypothetical protein
MSILTELGKERKSLSDVPIRLTGLSASLMYVNILISIYSSKAVGGREGI